MRSRLIGWLVLAVAGVSLCAGCGLRREPAGPSANGGGREPQAITPVPAPALPTLPLAWTATPAPTGRPVEAASPLSPTASAAPVTLVGGAPGASDQAGDDLERLLDELHGALDQADTLEDARDLIP